MPNLHVIQGNIGRAELKYTASGKAVFDFSVAVNKRTKDQQTGEWKTVFTTWYKGAAWEDQALRYAETVREGAFVIVTAEHTRLDTWEKDGKHGASIELVGNVTISIIPPKVTKEPTEADEEIS